jgi:glucokinase
MSRPSTSSQPSTAYLAVDIGGTKLAAGVVGLDGSVLIRDRVPTPARAPWPALARLVSRVQAALPGVTLQACGVGVGGPMEPGGERVSPLHIPTWRGFPLHSALAELTGLPVHIDNDAKALALAEGWQGAAIGEQNFIAVVVATGVGAGIVLEGRLLDGKLGNAGHIGHMVVEPDGKPCACGGRGCLEAYICGPAVAAESGRPPRRAPLPLIERNGRMLGRALASVAALLDLRLALVGGSVALGYGQPFFEAAQAELHDRARLSFVQGAVVRPVGLGELGPLVGAAAVAHRAEHPI